MARYEIGLDKRYRIPHEICVVNYMDKILVIAPMSANWIVLEDSSQLDVFRLFEKGYSVNEILQNHQFKQQDVRFVVTQLEARRLCGKSVHFSTENERSLHLYLTNNCNLSCPHCYMFSGKSEENELTTEEIVNLIKDYKTIAKGTKVTLSGGEPLIRHDFDEIVKTAAELDLQVKVLTNGSLISSRRIAELSDCIHSVQISIDGYSEETNSKIRGKGHFQKALSAIDTFVEHGIETSVAMTPTLELLKNNIKGYIAFAKEMAVRYADKPFRVKFSEGLSFGREIIPSKEMNEEYAALMQDIQKNVYGEEYELIAFVETMSNNVIQDNCMFGALAVAADGNVYFCPEIGELLPLSNIRTTSFKEILEESIIAERATSVTKLKPCKDCELRYICGGGCRIKEFPELVKRTSFKNINYNDIPYRNCTSSIKERFYSLMVQSNEYLYLPLTEY